MFGKLFGKKKDAKGKGKKGAKGAAADTAADNAASAPAETPEPAPAAAAKKSGNGDAGKSKPKVEVIDAMGNSVAAMVTDIAEQLAKSRRYSNFAMIVLAVTLLSTGGYLAFMSYSLSSRLNQVDETLTALTSQSVDQEESNSTVSEIKDELVKVASDLAVLKEQSVALDSAPTSVTAENVKALTVLIEKVAADQAVAMQRIEAQGVSSQANPAVLGEVKQLKRSVESMQQVVADLYTIEKARIAAEIQARRVAQPAS